MVFGRTNIIVRGYDLFLLEDIDGDKFADKLHIRTNPKGEYMFFAFDSKDNMILNADFADDLYRVFLNLPLITRVHEYSVGIADIWELFKRYIDINEFEITGRVIEESIRHIDKDGIFTEFVYSQGFFLFSVDYRRLMEKLLALTNENIVKNDIFIENGMNLLDGKSNNNKRKVDELEAWNNVLPDSSRHVIEKGRIKEKVSKYGEGDAFELPKKLVIN